MIRAIALLVAPLLCCSALVAQAGTDWPTFGGAPGGSQYSRLDQIDVTNVARLERAWDFRSREPGQLEATPIHANDTLYFCTFRGSVIALDPKTGDKKWRFNPYSGKGGTGLVPERRKGTRCRNVAYWEAPSPDDEAVCGRRVFKSDFLGNVYAIDADTGKSCADFGAPDGHAGYVSHWDYEGNGHGSRGITSGPIVVNDLLISASGVDDTYADANDGFVRAFDVRSGELVWEFNPIPAEHVRDTGAANVWSTMSADLERGLVFLPTTSPSSDFYGVTRKFAIPYATSTVALNVATGKPAWHYQIVRHNIYDYDLPGHPLLVTIRKDGRSRDVAIQQTKVGYIFVFDRDSGEPVFPIDERPVPRSDLPGEVAAPTQPVPLLPQPLMQERLSRDELWGLTPLGRHWCRKRYDELSYDGMFTAPSENGSLYYPGIAGGGNWGGAAFDPNSNLLVVRLSNLATQHWMIRNEGGAITPLPDRSAGRKGKKKGPGEPLPGTPYTSLWNNFVAPSGAPCTPPPWGTLTAVDMDSGEIRWRRPFGQARRYGITLPERWGSPLVGGPIVTAGGLIFMAGSMDRKIRALDVRTGEELWQEDLPYAGMAVPMTYMADGKQYVVIAAGGNRLAETREGDAIVAFTLKD